MEGGSICALFAATYPGRTTGLVLFGSLARGAWAPDYPWGWTDDRWREDEREVEETWETSYPKEAMGVVIPSLASDEDVRRWFAEDIRLAASASSFRMLQEMFKDIDIRAVLPTIQVPTLVLHPKDDKVIPIDEGRYLADRIAGARFVELPGADHLPWAEDHDVVAGEIEASWKGRLRRRPTSIGSWRRCCSRTSWTPPRGPPRSATASGRSCSDRITRGCVDFSPDIGERRSIRRATASSRRSRGRRERSGARLRSSSPCEPSTSTSAPACTRVNASSWRGR
jgi:hypothetical protein